MQRLRLRSDQLAEEPQRILGPVEVLAIIDDEHERLDEEPGKLRKQLTGGREHVDPLRRGREVLGQCVRGAGRHPRDRIEDPQQQDPGRSLRRGATDPRDRPGTPAQRLLENRRLAIPGARDQKRVTGRKGVTDPGGEPGP
jgi:hypothetical protein